MTKFFDGEAVRWRGRSYRCHPHEVPGVYIIRDAKGNTFLVYECELESSFEAEVDMIWQEENSKLCGIVSAWPTEALAERRPISPLTLP